MDTDVVKTVGTLEIFAADRAFLLLDRSFAAMEERALIEEYRALGGSVRPCLCPLMKRIKLLEAANLYQLVVARKQNWQGISYKDACWMAYYTVRERWGDHYPFWDDDFGLDVHQDVIRYFESKDNGATLTYALIAHQFMIRTTQIVKLECYQRYYTSTCMEYMEGRKAEIIQRMNDLPSASQEYLANWKVTFVTRLPTSMRHIGEEMCTLHDSSYDDN